MKHTRPSTAGKLQVPALSVRVVCQYVSTCSVLYPLGIWTSAIDTTVPRFCFVSPSILVNRLTPSRTTNILLSKRFPILKFISPRILHLRLSEVLKGESPCMYFRVTSETELVLDPLRACRTYLGTNYLKLLWDEVFSSEWVKLFLDIICSSIIINRSSIRFTTSWFHEKG